MSSPIDAILKRYGKTWVKNLRAEMRRKRKNATGQTSGRLRYSVRPNRLEVTAPAYFRTLIEGRKPSRRMPPISAIQRWINAKGLGRLNAYVVARRIKERGTNPRFWAPRLVDDAITDRDVNDLVDELADFAVGIWVNGIEQNVNS